MSSIADTLHRDGPQAWRRAASGLDNFQARCTERSVNFGKEAPEYTFGYCADAARSRRLLVFPLKDAGETRIVLNSDYHFSVTRPNPSSPYALASGQLKGKEDLRTDILAPDIQPAERENMTRVNAGLNIFGVNLSDIVADSKFSLRSAEAVDRPGGSLVRVEYVYTGPSRPPFFEGGVYWAELNPQNYWLIESAGRRVDSRGVEQQETVSYQVGPSSLPFPATVRQKLSVASKENSERMVVFSDLDFCKWSDEEFYLPFYGISEQAVGLDRRSFWYRFLLVGAGLARC